ncbi:hypothetical protein B0J14DRAFT_703972 [Halenospora varia]|nr:hypothetical protein B0J14DRAFT_703972 [Halenospora varia]
MDHGESFPFVTNGCFEQTWTDLGWVPQCGSDDLPKSRELTGPTELETMLERFDPERWKSNTVTPSPCSSPQQTFSPPFSKPLPSNIDKDTLEYLQESGAFDVPSDQVRTGLLKAYLEFIHPSLPVLDTTDLLQLQSLSNNIGDSTIGIFLLQAIFAAGSSVASQDVLRMAGWRSEREVCKTFFKRAKLFHALDCEDDAVASIQALLLVTLTYEVGEYKDISYWISCAISYLDTLLEDKYRSGLKTNPAKEKLYRRLWWCCYIRDRAISFGTGRPIQLRVEDYNISELSISDLDRTGTGSSLIRSSEGEDTRGHCTAEIIIEKARLLQFADGLRLSRNASQIAWNKKYNKYIEWRRQLPSYLHLDYHLKGHRCRPEIIVQLAMLHLIFWSTILTTFSITSATDLAVSHARLAIYEISQVVTQLQDTSLIIHLPLTAISIVAKAMSACLQHLSLQPGSASTAFLTRSLENLLDALRVLSPRHAIAQHVFQLFVISTSDLMLNNLVIKPAISRSAILSLAQSGVHLSHFEALYETLKPYLQDHHHARENETPISIMKSNISSVSGGESEPGKKILGLLDMSMYDWVITREQLLLNAKVDDEMINTGVTELEGDSQLERFAKEFGLEMDLDLLMNA